MEVVAALPLVCAGGVAACALAALPLIMQVLAALPLPNDLFHYSHFCSSISSWQKLAYWHGRRRHQTLF